MGQGMVCEQKCIFICLSDFSICPYQLEMYFSKSIFQAGTKLVCAILSLPIPSKSFSSTCGEQLNSMGTRTVPDYLEHRTLQKILLVGYSGSGTSTIFKQVIFLVRNWVLLSCLCKIFSVITALSNLILRRASISCSVIDLTINDQRYNNYDPIV